MKKTKIFKERIAKADEDIDTRYPVHWPTNYTKETAIKVKDSVRKIRNWIFEKLEAL